MQRLSNGHKITRTRFALELTTNAADDGQTTLIVLNGTQKDCEHCFVNRALPLVVLPVLGQRLAIGTRVAVNHALVVLAHAAVALKH